MTKTNVDASNINILNTIRETRSLSYQDRIPEANSGTIDAIYETILNVEAIRNDFVHALVERIGMVAIHQLLWQNPLRSVKESSMPYAQVEQEIFVNFAKGNSFNPQAGYEEAFAYYEANVMAAYHKMSPAIQYAITISFDQLRSAFTNPYGIRDLIRAKINSLINGANWDEFLMCKALVDSAYENGILYPIHVAKVTDKDTAEAALIAMKAAIGKMKFPKPEYNIAGADSFSERDNLILISDPDTMAYIDVKALAMAYNEGRADIDVETILIDGFKNTGIQAFLCDRRWFKVKDRFRTLSDQKNASALSWNYFYTVQEMFSISPFMPAVVLTTENIGTPTVEITNTDYTPGTEVKLTSDLEGEGYVPKIVDYKVSGENSTETYIIPGSNILMVGTDETSTLTITATLRYDPSVTNTKAITKKA